MQWNGRGNIKRKERSQVASKVDVVVGCVGLCRREYTKLVEKERMSEQEVSNSNAERRTRHRMYEKS